MKKVVIYARISKEDQSAYSIVGQIEACKEYIEREKYELTETYIDDGYSAKNMDRPQLKRMLADMAAKKFDIFVIWRLDRLTRNTLDGLNMVNTIFKRHNVDFASVTEDIDTSTPDGMMMFTIRLSMAQNEREKIAERASMGQMNRAKDGKRNTSAKPYGYNVGEDLSLTINEEEAEVVRNIYKWYIGGYGRDKIARILNFEERVPSARGGLWRDKIIGDIISNITNIGAVHYKRKNDPEEKRIIRHGAHPPIVSMEVFEAAQKIKQRRRDHDMSLSSYDFPFSSIVKCGECGRSYHGKLKSLTPGGKNRTRNYRCSGKYRQDSCSASDIAESKLTTLLLEFIQNIRFETDDPNKPLLTRDVSKERKKLEKLLADSAARRKNYARAMGDGKMSYEDFSELVEEEQTKMKKWQEELDELLQYVPDSTRNRKDVLRQLENLSVDWDCLSIQERKANINKLFHFIVIKKRESEWEIVAYKLTDN